METGLRVPPGVEGKDKGMEEGRAWYEVGEPEARPLSMSWTRGQGLPRALGWGDQGTAITLGGSEHASSWRETLPGAGLASSFFFLNKVGSE